MRLVKRMNIQFSFGFNFKIEKRVIGEKERKEKPSWHFHQVTSKGDINKRGATRNKFKMFLVDIYNVKLVHQNKRLKFHTFLVCTVGIPQYTLSIGVNTKNRAWAGEFSKKFI
jgi:hypothetical protein